MQSFFNNLFCLWPFALLPAGVRSCAYSRKVASPYLNPSESLSRCRQEPISLSTR